MIGLADTGTDLGQYLGICNYVMTVINYIDSFSL